MPSKMMIFSDTKKYIAGLILTGLFAGGLLSFCYMFDMPADESMPMENITYGVMVHSSKCVGLPSSCPQMVSSSLKDLLRNSPVAQKVLTLFAVIVFAYVWVFTVFPERRLLRLHIEHIPPPNYLVLAFARGILHPKLYNA